jgi:phosphatidylinositol alpha-mannosyltransferase
VRIGVVTEDYYPSYGAVAEHVHGFAREARRLGHVVKIITGAIRGAPDEDRDDRGEDVVRIGTSRALLRHGGMGRVTAGATAALRDVLARERLDVLHARAAHAGAPLLAVHHATVPVVGSFHAHILPGLLLRRAHRTQQRYLDRLDAAVAVSNACLAPLGGQLPADVRIIPGGVDVDRFSRGRRLRRFDDGKVNVLWAGRVEKRNGLDVLIAAFHRAWKQIDARLVVLGDGPKLARCRAMVPSEMADDVVFAGRAGDDRPDWFATADVFCAPAQAPSGGLTLLEAMAAGKPILASDLDGYRDVLTHGREGELLSSDDPGAWARAIVRLSREPVRAAAYGERGRVTAQRFAWPTVAREMLGLYRSIGVRG